MPVEAVATPQRRVGFAVDDAKSPSPPRYALTFSGQFRHRTTSVLQMAAAVREELQRDRSQSLAATNQQQPQSGSSPSQNAVSKEWFTYFRDNHFEEFKYYNVEDIDVYFAVKIVSLDGLAQLDNRQSFLQHIIRTQKFSLEGYENNDPKMCLSAAAEDAPLVGCTYRDVYVECSLRSSTTGQYLCDAIRTSYRSHESDGEILHHNWDEWIVFPVKYRELRSDTVLCVTVWDAFSPRTKCCIGGVTAPIVTQRKGKIKSGIRQVKLWSHMQADLCPKNAEHNGDYASASPSCATPGQLKILHEKSGFENALKLYGNKPVSWLDQLTFKHVHEMPQTSRSKRNSGLILNLELQQFDYPVVFPHLLIDNTGAVPLSIDDSTPFTSGNRSTVMSMATSSSSSSSTTTVKTKARSGQTTLDSRRNMFEYRRPNDDSSSAQQWINDPEVDLSNLVEEKHLKMTLYVSNPMLDKELKPNASEMRRIKDAILDSPPLHEFSLEDKKLLWKFRYYLSSNKKALVKFLRSIDWSYAKEAKEACMLLELWTEVDTVDALFLLSRYFVNVESVRNYAVNILSKADDDTLSDVLLQLVQALRYETQAENSNLARLLIERATKNFEIANNLNWFLIVEYDDKKYGDVFKNVHHQLWVQLKKRGSDLFLERLVRQGRLVSALQQLGKQLKQEKENRPKKILRLKKILASKTQHDQYKWGDILFGNISKQFPPSPLALPLNPAVEVTGFIADEAHIFKSAMSPLLLPFRVAAPAVQHAPDQQASTSTAQEQGQHVQPEPATHSARYFAIYKHGDDMRQDQLVIQIITLMDKILKRNGLDLKLTPYRVLATSQDSGLSHCVTPSIAMSKIPRGDIRAWLKKCNSNPDDYNMACQNFVKSCAGYCVITYILGVGDRHLDNILICPDGRLFHIDFGFVLGRDPKPFPPPCKLSKEMVEGMGGTRSEGYQKFTELCCTAYNILRSHSDLIISLFVLMVDANIPDIEHGSVDPIRNIGKVQDKFKLDMSDAEAMQFFMQILLESERALFPQITEMFHTWAQYWRA